MILNLKERGCWEVWCFFGEKIDVELVVLLVGRFVFWSRVWVFFGVGLLVVVCFESGVFGRV